MRTVLFNLVLLFVCARGAAWDPSVECPGLSDDAVEAQITAGRLFQEAEEHYQASRPIEALKGFLCSLQIIQHENTVFNIAQIAKLSKHREASLGLLRDFVSHARGSTKVDPIREIIAELEGENTPGPEEQDTGPASPKPPSEVTTPKPEPVADKDVPATTVSAEPEKDGLRTTGWVLFGTGAAAAVVGGVLQGLTGGAHEDAEKADSYPDFQDAEDRMKNLQTGAIVGFSAGGAIIATGLVLVLVSEKSEKQSSDAISVSWGPGAILLRGRF